MQFSWKKIIAVTCVGAVLFSCTSCNNIGNATVLAEPATAEEFAHNERTEEFYAFTDKVNDFSAKFASTIYEDENVNNFAVSPLSVFMGLSMASACANGETQNEILSALNVSQAELQTNIPLLYRSLQWETKTENFIGIKKETGKFLLTNSIWVDKQITAKQDCLDVLSNQYFCHVLSTDFINDNQGSNKAIRNFVKKQTNGLIDTPFHYTPLTGFTLLNTLYLKDLWNSLGDDLPYADGEYSFENTDGTTTEKRLLRGYYREGRAYETGTFSSFFTSTRRGYKIKFILPKDGYSIQDVFTAENVDAINAIDDYQPLDHENMLAYNTRCLFPEFSASFDNELSFLLQQAFRISSLFDLERCDFTTLTDSPAYCTSVRHCAQLKVNKKGIEGAAITVIPGAGAPGPGEYEPVYVDFVVDRAFGFVISDPYDVPIFSGVIEKL